MEPIWKAIILISIVLFIGIVGWLNEMRWWLTYRNFNKSKKGLKNKSYFFDTFKSGLFLLVFGIIVYFVFYLLDFYAFYLPYAFIIIGCIFLVLGLANIKEWTKEKKNTVSQVYSKLFWTKKHIALYILLLALLIILIIYAFSLR